MMKIPIDVLSRLCRSFPRAQINNLFEFVADPRPRVNSYFRLEDCESEEDIIAKVLEYLSRDAYKSLHYSTGSRNDQVHAYHLRGINAFCGTSFTEDDIEVIYTYLGNGCNHRRTLDFIRSGYNLAMLTEEGKYG